MGSSTHADHPPPHVLKGGKRARIKLNPVAIDESDLKANEIRQALKVVEQNRAKLLESWRNIHSGDDEYVTE